LCVERSPKMIVGLLGILKAGGAYVPLDPAYPEKRLQYILEDAGIQILVTESHLTEWVSSDVERICLDENSQEIRNEPITTPVHGVTPENLAYVIYTSGSTGKPKGVMIENYNVYRLFASTNKFYKFSSSDVWTLFHSYAFDFSVWEIWGALLYGGRLIIVPYWISRSPEAFYKLLIDEKVTILNQTPSAFRQLANTNKEWANQGLELNLRYVIFGGEALDVFSLSTWFNDYTLSIAKLVNMYGITETTVHATYHWIIGNDVAYSKSSVIGKPIVDLEIYILDINRHIVPVGVTGELYVGGSGLARGYLNRPKLTAERFIPHPFSDEPGARLYRTGDLVRYLPDGNLEFVGRADDQVKIRGFRIELGEVEATLNALPSIQEAVVIVREDEPGEKRLVAYVVGEGTTKEWRKALKDKLPGYMVPAH
ncbi:peptide synthetase, partial [Bacillus stratosphericus]